MTEISLIPYSEPAAGAAYAIQIKSLGEAGVEAAGRRATQLRSRPPPQHGLKVWTTGGADRVKGSEEAHEHANLKERAQLLARAPAG